MLRINIFKDHDNIYRIKDETGQEMKVTDAQIIGAVKNGKAELLNAVIENNRLKLNYTESDTKEVHKLVDKLNDARKVYEQGTDELMSNKEYDELYDKLEKTEEKTGLILANSPTHNVGYEVVSKLEKYKFSSPMLSLSKTKSVGELKSFLGDKQGVISTKMDGLTVVIIYENGELSKAITRGNGEIGEIVTNNARHFVNLPHKISHTGTLVLRGEAIMKYSDFKRLNTSGEYKNPRNLCSGSVRQLDSRITAERRIHWYAFSVVEGIQNNSFTEQMNVLKSLGFDIVEHISVNRNNIEQTVKSFTDIVKKSDIPTDGLVLTYDDIAYGKSLGRTAKSPRHSIAFKWEDEEHISKLRDIEWSVGRTGVITPVAIFDPIEIEGSVVSRASLHNLSVMYDILGQPYVGQKIHVFKANLIIPQIAYGEKLQDGEYD